VDPLLMAAALAQQAQRGAPLLQKPRSFERPHSDERDRTDRGRPDKARYQPASEEPRGAREPRRQRERPEAAEVELFRVEVGRNHGAEPRNIVGAIANEAGVEPRYIGKIEIGDDFSTVELPVGMPKPIFEHLKSVWVAGRRLGISRVGTQTPDRHANKKALAKARADERRRQAPPDRDSKRDRKRDRG
jgi:ATP-dependent RNA helicase DeaD